MKVIVKDRKKYTLVVMLATERSKRAMRRRGIEVVTVDGDAYVPVRQARAANRALDAWEENRRC